ncbi:MAG: hypothetical protein ACT4TC_08545 [Myxococcaceae bacterium]
MIKICPACRRTFSGGTVCLHCKQEVALLDVADPAVRRAHLRADGDLRVTIRTYYGARSAMLMLFVGILFGLAFGVALLRKGFSEHGTTRAAVFALALSVAVLLPLATTFIGARVVHLFSKSCRKKPLKAMDLRVVRRGQDLA